MPKNENLPKFVKLLIIAKNSLIRLLTLISITNVKNIVRKCMISEFVKLVSSSKTDIRREISVNV